MPANSTPIIHLLEIATEVLTFESEGSYPFEIIDLYENTEEFFLWKLLQKNQIIQNINEDDFIEDVSRNLTDISRSYIQIHEIFKDQCVSINIFKIITNELESQNEFYPGLSSFYLTIIQLRSGFFAGFSTRLGEDLAVGYGNISGWLSLFPGWQVNLTEETLLLAHEYEEIRSNTKFPSFEDTREIYPFNDFVIDFSSTESQLIEKLLHSTEFVTIERFEVSSFGWEWEDEYTKQITSLAKLLNQNLAETKFYQFGICERPIYIVGKENDGHYVGLSTIAVET